MYIARNRSVRPRGRASALGMSLAELVIASFLALLLMTATYELLIPGLRAWTVSNKRSHVRQTTLLSLNRIARDLTASCVESVLVRPGALTDPTSGATEEAYGMSFLSALDDSGRIRQQADGSIIWQRYEVVYLDPWRHVLYIGYRPLLFDDSENLAMRLEHFAPDPSVDRPLARGVRAFWAEAAVDALASDFSDSSEPVRTNPITLGIHVRDDTEDCTLTTAVNAALAGDPIDASARP